MFEPFNKYLQWQYVTDLCGESTDDLSMIQIIIQFRVNASMGCSLLESMSKFCLLLALGRNVHTFREWHAFI